MLRARCLTACRAAFSADLVLATCFSGSKKARILVAGRGVVNADEAALRYSSRRRLKPGQS
jgi:hypothetical protein